MTESPAGPTGTGLAKPIIVWARLVTVVLASWIALAVVSLPTRLHVASEYAYLGSEGNPHNQDPAIAFNHLGDQDLRLVISTAAATIVAGICLLGWFRHAHGNARRHGTRLTSQLNRPLQVWWLGLSLLTTAGGLTTALFVILQNIRPYTPGQGQIATAHTVSICQTWLTLTGILVALLTIRIVRKITAHQQRTT